jgi:hypothetical protein
MTSKNWTQPTITFSNSPEMEARRVLFLTASLTRNWYQKHNFLILPKLYQSIPTSQTIIPDLPYSSIPNYWTKVSKLKLTTPINAPLELLNSTQSLIQKDYDSKLHQKYLAKLEAKWIKIAPSFWNNLFTLFPNYRGQIKHINIYSTQYGPISTFSLASGPNTDITIFMRHDADVDKLIWTILASLFRGKMEYQMKHTWEEIETTLDWLMSESALSTGIKLTHPIIKNIRSNQLASSRTKSQKYLASLGLTTTSVWRVDQSDICFGDTKILNLSENEQKLLELLLTKRGQTTSYDEIANLLWPNGENFSLFAISKEIERLRKRIKAAGVIPAVIHTHRKVGYSIT